VGEGGELCGDVDITDYCGNVVMDQAARGGCRGVRYWANQTWCEKSDVGVE